MESDVLIMRDREKSSTTRKRDGSCGNEGKQRLWQKFKEREGTKRHIQILIAIPPSAPYSKSSMPRGPS